VKVVLDTNILVSALLSPRAFGVQVLTPREMIERLVAGFRG